MRLKSTAVWYDLPGVEAAYMPIGAPSAVDALMNVGRTDAQGNHRMAGRYTATPGVAPTWSAAVGHTYNGLMHLATNFIHDDKWSALCRFNATNLILSRYIYGARSSNTVGLSCAPNYSTIVWYGAGNEVSVAPALLSGVCGTAGRRAYRDGIDQGVTATYAGTNTASMVIGALSIDGSISNRFEGNIPAVLFASRTLSAAEMWLASRQMAYCEQNPDWNAWARRRRYYYAPSAVYAQKLMFAEQMRAMQ